MEEPRTGAFIGLDSAVLHPTGRMIGQLSVLRFMGGETLEDTARLDSKAVKGLFSWGSVADPTTFSRRLKKFEDRQHSSLRAISTKIARGSIPRGKQTLIAVDSTVVPVFGEKMEGVKIGYNPTKPGRPSYHPLLAVHVVSRSVIDGLWRPGNIFLSGLIAYNFFNFIRRKGLPYFFRTARLKRVALLFFNLGANVVKKTGRLIIKIGRDYPFRAQFYRAMDDLAPT